MTDTGSRTLVIGAGVIGAAIAHELQKRGRQVTLVDRDAPGRGASYGNMASIAVTEFMPASRPSVWRQIPGWLLDPEGPIRVRPAAMPRLVPWFLRFLAASRPGKLRELEAQGAALCERALPDTEALLREIGAESELSQEGCLSLYTDEAEFRADRDHIEILERYGFRHEILGQNVVRDLEPEITTRIGKAVLFPDNRSLKDPYRYVTRLVERFEGLGGRIVRGNVTGFERSDRIDAVLLDDGTRLGADEVVLCAGAYTARLSKKLGEPIPLETERGYHTQIAKPGISMRHSIIWPARAFMVTPTAGGIRVGGTVEMAGLDAAPDYRRAKITVKRAREALPNLSVEDTTEWMGHRPALPDTVPVMSESGKTRGVYYATGHGHLGLTYAATCARLMGQLVTGERPELDLHPYRINRF
ncbi:NAD(P)/FAD-dependent oxidoreductase [Roseovarius atlanticus]|uniref:NAD(P)/FAD-dependent oxidoreductase n=1 Tax=Roseovarius atlanticus TaxID=1641875 RepID=UPI001C960EE1|nr:FAD-binding oxidoreductase [Roseovarius atlanticus]MBY5986553.1 FAD-binding oxidoreductase [Roseovarius atlanticus]MBY6125193.1 FAD-binding oxidoreductase [Roseovarius atlanticus]MBY6150346.1 FAD-binding oxidoreductase [Roseovarius atlanticus]